MLQILALAGGIASLLVAVVEIRKIIEEQKNANLLMLASSIIVVGIALHLTYFGPKSAGDAWTVALRNLDMHALRSVTCDDGPIARGTSGINATARVTWRSDGKLHIDFQPTFHAYFESL